MAKGIEYLDELNNRIYVGVDAGNETIYTVQQFGSYIKEALQKAPYIDNDKLFTWSGFEEYQPNTYSGVIMIMQGWTIWALDQPSKHRIRFTQGLILDSLQGDPFGTPDNVIWSVAEQSVSALLATTGTVSGSSRPRTLDK